MFRIIPPPPSIPSSLRIITLIKKTLIKIFAFVMFFFFSCFLSLTVIIQANDNHNNNDNDIKKN